MPLTVWITTNWKILIYQTRIPDHLTCLLRNLYAGQESTARTDMKQLTDSKLGKEYHYAVYCRPGYLYAEYIMQNTKLGESQTRIKIAGKNINHLRYADDTTLTAESKEELKSLFTRVKEESEKVNIQKTKILASGPIASWQIEGKKVETMTDFLFLGSQITADGDCSHEIRRRLLLGKKAKTNLDSVLKSKDITLPTKVCIVKAMVFPLVMYGCESWLIKKAQR